jgi:hypothetical protein
MRAKSLKKKLEKRGVL